MAVSVELGKLLDKAYEDKSLSEVLDAPVSALAGLTDQHGEELSKLLKVKSIRDLGTNKYIVAAVALASLDRHTD